METAVATAKPPVIFRTHSALDNTSAWMRSGAYESPLSLQEIENVQQEIDSIVGTGRSGRPIIKLVWNGDQRYWKEYHDKWDANGQALSDTYKRPQVLYRSIYDNSDQFVRDAFPPRWLLLTRLEPEQYADTWAKDSKFWCPERKTWVQVLPAECPKERYIWFETIALHTFGCCQRAESEGHSCFGKYVHPRACLDGLRRMRRGMENDGVWNDSHPFDSPDRVSIRLREKDKHNYTDQAMKKFVAQRDYMLDEAPLALASPTEFMKTPELPILRKVLKERSKKDVEKFEKDLKRREL